MYATSGLDLKYKEEEVADPEHFESKSSCHSLLTLLHDKNKVIEKLQKQLQFQKLQLKYYLNRSLSNRRLAEFSKTCFAPPSDENMPVTLALTRYCKQMGYKSQIMTLYQRMNDIEGQVSANLVIQEALLRKIVNCVCELSPEDQEVKVNFQDLISNSSYMEFFNNLLNANIHLRKKLENFKVCCDRLIVVEEERNMIVEQVYSMPAEQRTSCNYLISIQMEKIHLQKKVREILRDQELLKKKIEELNCAESHLRKLQEQYKAAYRQSNDFVEKMLKKVSSEAMSLISKSRDQKRKYLKEISKLRMEKEKANSMVAYLKSNLKSRDLEESFKLNSESNNEMMEVFEKEISWALGDGKSDNNSYMKVREEEYKQLMDDFLRASNDRDALDQQLEMTKSQLNKMQGKYLKEVGNLTRERDEYMSQVEDLKAIRSAYVHLAENRSELSLSEKRNAMEINRKNGRITELEEENVKLTLEVTKLREENNSQAREIHNLKEMLSRYMTLSPITLKCRTASEHRTAVENICGDFEDKLAIEKKLILDELEKANVSVEDLERLKCSKDLDEVTSKILQKLSRTSDTCIIDCIEEEPSGGSYEKIVETQNPLVVTMNYDRTPRNEEVLDNNLATCFEILSSHRDGKRDRITAVLEGRDKVEGTIKMGQSSLLTLRVDCLSADFHSNANDKRLLSITKSSEDCELMKDCSLETVASLVPPIKRAIATFGTDRFTSIPDVRADADIVRRPGRVNLRVPTREKLLDDGSVSSPEPTRENDLHDISDQNPIDCGVLTDEENQIRLKDQMAVSDMALKLQTLAKTVEANRVKSMYEFK